MKLSELGFFGPREDAEKAAERLDEAAHNLSAAFIWQSAPIPSGATPEMLSDPHRFWSTVADSIRHMAVELRNATED